MKSSLNKIARRKSKVKWVLSINKDTIYLSQSIQPSKEFMFPAALDMQIRDGSKKRKMYISSSQNLES